MRRWRGLRHTGASAADGPWPVGRLGVLAVVVLGAAFAVACSSAPRQVCHEARRDGAMEKRWRHHMLLVDHLDNLSDLLEQASEPGIAVIAVETYVTAQDPTQRGLAAAIARIEARFDEDDWARFDAGPGAVVAKAHERFDRAIFALERQDSRASWLVAETIARWLDGR